MTTAWQTVALREIAVRATAKSFLTSLAVTLVLIIGGIAAYSWFSDRGTETTVAVSSSQAQRYVEQAETTLHESSAQDSLTPERVGSDQEAIDRVERDEADLALIQRGGHWSIVTPDGAATQHSRILTEVITEDLEARAAAEQGVDLTALRAEARVSLEGTDSSQQVAAGRVLSFVFAILFYLAAVVFGMGIAQSILEEKSHRVVEIIAAAVPVRQVLIGKLAANIGLALGQLVLYLAAGLLAMNLFDVGLEMGWVLRGSGWFLAFFLVGFSILAALWAVAGAMADRPEDLSATSTPLTTILMVLYFAGLLASGTVQTVLSWVPLASSVVMPLRLVQGTAGPVEGAASLGLGLLALVLITAWAGRVYRRAVLRTGTRLRWGQVLTGRS
ncbi:ABC transporter permease [Rothia kristinae]|uniref:ABC transporter permease n=1 Tax=Rothia kristinae TaxID=37923 RepID=A0A7T4T4N2_9MICC|nr:ABC transporter permease [Rothia kristinae]QQC59435.1 ABC transporter permease [Rothia kristinae]